ncbi:MAG: chemotaxis protein CheB [Gemmataceae bacterium]
MKNRGTASLNLHRLEDRLTPAVMHLLSVGADFGALPEVRVLDASTGSERFRFDAYDQAFRGGVRVAVGDVNGDGVDDIITGANASGGSHVRIFSGVDASLIREFFAYDASFQGGVSIAAGDVNLDGFADIITGAGAGGGPHVKVFSGKDGSLLREFFAYDAAFTGGVNVAAGDVNGDGRSDIITGAGFGGGPHVRAFSGASGILLDDFFAYDAGFHGGVFVATGDADGDGRADIITGPGNSGGPHVRIFNGAGASLLSEFFANSGGSNYFGGTRVAAGYLNNDIRLDVVTISGFGGDSEVRNYDALTGQPVSDFSGFSKLVSQGAAFVGHQSEFENNTVVDWNEAALRAITTTKMNPPRASRAMAILQVAEQNALNDLSLSSFPTIAAPTHEGVVAAAAHRVLTNLFPTLTADFDRLLAGSLAVTTGGGNANAVTIGQNAADAELAARANDGANASSSYVPDATLTPGRWQPTPAAFAAALEPQWGQVTLFSGGTASTYLPPAPPDLTTPEYAAAFNEVKDVGSKTSTTRTADQTQIALFWADGSGTGTPPGHWNRIAAQQAQRAGLTLSQTARLFYQLDIAEADAAIICWNTKFTDDLWRPVTAIRRADVDGNAATDIDASWTPLINTPNFPTYTSGHSTFSGAAATILDGYFGSSTSFRTYSQDFVDVSRGFTSFQNAADEAGQSRIYGGIHFQFDNVEGKAEGRALGAFVLANT